MQFRNISLGSLFLLVLFFPLLAGCSAASSVTAIPVTPTVRPCSTSSVKCPILTTPTPVPAKVLAAHFNDTNVYPNGQNHLIAIVGTYYTANQAIQVSIQAVPDMQGAAHTYGYSTTSGGPAGEFGVAVVYRCLPSADISATNITIIGLETDDYSGASTVVPLSSFCGNNTSIPADFFFTVK